MLSNSNTPLRSFLKPTALPLVINSFSTPGQNLHRSELPPFLSFSPDTEQNSANDDSSLDTAYSTWDATLYILPGVND